MLYLDTSALMPYYRHEAASSRVQAMLVGQDKPVLISHLTAVEVASTLARWVRMNELTEPQANRIESAFRDDLHSGRFQICPIDAAHYRRASHWISTRKTALRTLDALHLACADSHQATLVSEDETLINAAQFFGIDATFAR
jgi:uncharacterized protein